MYPASNFLPNSPRDIQKVSDGLEEEGFLPQENRKSAVYSENF